MQPSVTEQERLPATTLMAYALAAAGGVIGYLPLLTLLLPLKLQALADGERYGVLAVCGVVGAIAAGVANVAFGWLGDGSVARGGRRGWLLGGMIATAASFAAIATARGPVSIVCGIVAFQIAINAALAQIGALMAEEIPAGQKGAAAALLTLGTPFAAGASALVIALGAGEGARLAMIAVLMTGCMMPLLFVAGGRAVEPAVAMRGAGGPGGDLLVAWVARLLMQVAGCGVGLYLLYYFERLVGGRADTPTLVTRVLVVATVVSVPLAILLGRWSDRIGRRRLFLAAAAGLATLGLAAMALARSWSAGAIGYAGFASGSAVFLALNTGHVMAMLPDPARRGRDLGYVNLANTVPQIVASVLAWWSVTTHDLTMTMAVLAGTALLAGVLPLAVRDAPASPL